MEKSNTFHIMYYKGRVADPGKAVGLTSPREVVGSSLQGVQLGKNLRIGVEVNRMGVGMNGEKQYQKI